MLSTDWVLLTTNIIFSLMSIFASLHRSSKSITAGVINLSNVKYIATGVFCCTFQMTNMLEGAVCIFANSSKDQRITDLNLS